MSDDINPDLENLVLQGAAIDAGADAEASEAAGIAPVDPMAAVNEWMLVPEVLSWIITSIYPETAPSYTPERKMQLATAIVPVAEKYGLSGVGDSPELMLGVAALGFGMPAYLAHQARKKAKEQEAETVENGSNERG